MSKNLCRGKTGGRPVTDRKEMIDKIADLMMDEKHFYTNDEAIYILFMQLSVDNFARLKQESEG